MLVREALQANRLLRYTLPTHVSPVATQFPEERSFRRHDCFRPVVFLAPAERARASQRKDPAVRFALVVSRNSPRDPVRLWSGNRFKRHRFAESRGMAG